MKRIILAALIAGICLIGFLRVAAAAATISAYGGATLLPEDQHCIGVYNDYGAVRNECAKSVDYLINLPTRWDNSNYSLTSTTVKVWGYSANSTATLSCRVMESQEEDSFYSGDWQTVTAIGITTMLSFQSWWGSCGYPYGGSRYPRLLVRCRFGGIGAKLLDVVNYTY